MPNGVNDLNQVLTDAGNYGGNLAKALFESKLSDEEKEAWVALVPIMTLEQLAKFERYLVAVAQKTLSEEFSAELMAIKAALMNHELEKAIINQRFMAGLDKLAAELDALEKQGGKN